MPKGGQLRIETANVTLRHEQFPHEIEAVSGDFVMLSVSDTGCGIAAEHINQVFEPFYTTKAKGTGAGMGLSMVYGFLRQSGGHIKLASEPGAGTRVSLYLARKAEAQGTVTLQPQESPVKTILLVEDDEFVRRYAEGLLRNLGFRVITAADGPSALMVLKELSQLSLLFTDIVMPGGMFGGELVDAVRSLRPDLPVLLSTGYSETEITGHGPLPANAPVLRKPYSPQQLAEAVERCLSPSGASATT
jgi:CheY-like chemotaxis protein